MSSAPASIDPAIVEAKIGAAFGAFGGVMVSSMIYVGHRLGLYKAMAGKGPLTSDELAAHSGLKERFVREWMYQQGASGVLDSRGGG